LSTTLLSATGISKRFGSKLVLDQAGFSVQEGELLGLIGPNGAGKTTLFECLAGLIPKDAGEVSLRGELLYLPDAIRPWPDQRVEWALRFFEGLYQRNEAQHIVWALKLDSLLGSRIGSLSKGELKRFLLALGLLTPHPLLLLDEPFDGLDFRQTRDVMSLLRTYPAQGRTLFLSIHQLSDAARVCDRLILLSGGRVVGQGTLEELRVHAGLESGGLEEIFLALT
jgi:ABC-2 type transport system ATP-binding protein